MAGNQHVPDPRQQDFLKYYLDRKSDTFSNAYRSAQKAGYGEEYCKNLTAQMPTWLSENIRDEKLIKMAENNLETFLSDDEDDKRVKADMTKFTLKGLKKDKYSERQEHTGKDGKPIEVNIALDDNTFKNIIGLYGSNKTTKDSSA